MKMFRFKQKFKIFYLEVKMIIFYLNPTKICRYIKNAILGLWRSILEHQLNKLHRHGCIKLIHEHNSKEPHGWKNRKNIGQFSYHLHLQHLQIKNSCRGWIFKFLIFFQDFAAFGSNLKISIRRWKSPKTFEIIIWSLMVYR